VESEAMVGTYEYMDMGFQKKAGPMMTLPFIFDGFDQYAYFS